MIHILRVTHKGDERDYHDINNIHKQHRTNTHNVIHTEFVTLLPSPKKHVSCSTYPNVQVDATLWPGIVALLKVQQDQERVLFLAAYHLVQRLGGPALLDPLDQ